METENNFFIGQEMDEKLIRKESNVLTTNDLENKDLGYKDSLQFKEYS